MHLPLTPASLWSLHAWRYHVGTKRRGLALLAVDLQTRGPLSCHDGDGVCRALVSSGLFFLIPWSKQSVPTLRFSDLIRLSTSDSPCVPKNASCLDAQPTALLTPKLAPSHAPHDSQQPTGVWFSEMAGRDHGCQSPAASKVPPEPPEYAGREIPLWHRASQGASRRVGSANTPASPSADMP